MAKYGRKYGLIPNLGALLWEAEKCVWLTSVNREEVQNGVGKNKLWSYNSFKTNFEAKPCVKANLPRAEGRMKLVFFLSKGFKKGFVFIAILLIEKILMTKTCYSYLLPFLE